jgi:hypothetical protein
LAIDFKNPSLSNLGNQSTDGARARMAVAVVERSPRLRGKKSIAKSNLDQLIGECTEHVDEVVWRILMVRVHFQRTQQTLNCPVELALPQVEEAQVAIPCGVLRIGLHTASQLGDSLVESALSEQPHGSLVGLERGDVRLQDRKPLWGLLWHRLGTATRRTGRQQRVERPPAGETGDTG